MEVMLNYIDTEKWQIYFFLGFSIETLGTLSKLKDETYSDCYEFLNIELKMTNHFKREDPHISDGLQKSGLCKIFLLMQWP